MAILNNMLSRLRREIAPHAGEQFGNERMTEFLDQSLIQHNAHYSWSTLPAREELAIIFLACSYVALARAQKLANDDNASLKSGSFNTSVEADTLTPFEKNLKLSKEYSTRYTSYCKSIGVDGKGSSGGVSKGRVVKRDLETEAYSPLSASNPIGSILLSSEEGDDNTELILSWDSEESFNFQEWVIFELSSSDPIYQAWSLETKDSIPSINGSSTKVQSIINQDQKSIKITGINRSVDHSFIVVGVTRSLKYSYSNEILLTSV